jgi:Arc/MetJ-type ribon-helix-helix transcriptional regulator
MFKTERIGVRLEPELRQKLESLVKAGKYSNFSEAVREAIKRFLAECEKA